MAVEVQASERGGAGPQWTQAVGPWLVAALLLLFASLAALSLLQDSTTFDETAHLVAGLSYLERGDFRLNPEHPPLAKVWAALPLALLGGNAVDYGSPFWAKADQWNLGYELLNGPLKDDGRRDPASRVVPARLAMVLLGVVLGLVVHAWAREMWGAPGALVALFLYVFCPTMLAHTRLVTTDLPAALGFTLTLWSAWRYFRRPGWARGTALGLALGLACLLKFSTLLLLPLLALSVAGWVLQPQPAPGRGKRLVLGAATLAGSVLLALSCVWAGYGFRYAAVPRGDYRLDWDAVRPRQPAVATGVDVARRLEVLPEAFLYGASFTMGHTRRLSFLHGQVFEGAPWDFLPQAFLLKTTPALLLLLVLLVATRSRGARAFDGWYLGASVALYAAANVFGGMTIGHRHLTPLYPLLFVYAGGALERWPKRAERVVLGVLLAGHALSALSTHPRYLSYFNLLASGPGGGWRHLVDSNLDWGQDLPRLRAWMDAHGVERVHLAYFGTADPKAYGISYRKVYQYMDFRKDEAASLPDHGDYLAVSATFLQGVYVPEELAKWLALVRTRLAPAGRAGDSIFIYRMP